jgi:hypothetical protein
MGICGIIFSSTKNNKTGGLTHDTGKRRYPRLGFNYPYKLGGFMDDE